MCGIVGYVGSREASPILLEGLRRLEYRGYDSAGAAVLNRDGLQFRKLSGRISDLAARIERLPLEGSCGVAHTRWATHGAPTTRNAHPHIDCSGSLAVVHNGIIENADALRACLADAGHEFSSDTDTEVLAHLIEAAPGASLQQRVISALEHVEGAYGLCVISQEDPQTLVVARKGSPVLLGIGQGEYFVASDASAILEHTRSVVYLNDGDVAVLTPRGYQVLDRAAQVQHRPVDAIEWDLEAIELGGYPHFMLKEICEQPESVRSALRGRLLASEGAVRLNGLNLPVPEVEKIGRVVIIGCGTSWHAGLVGRYLIEELAAIPVEVEYASEYRYRKHIAVPGTLTVAISQSGETADTLEALEVARALGSRVVGIVNVVGSTIARRCEGGIYLHAGPEIGVASTKAFTAQIVALALLGLYLGRARGLPVQRGKELVCELQRLPELVDRVLDLEPQIQRVAQEFQSTGNFLYLGRGIQFPVALEGALKLKEISYIHAEGYPAAEMKHGPIALIDQSMPVVFLAPKDDMYPKVVSNMQEVKARGGHIIAITTEGNGKLEGLVEHQLALPASHPLLSPVLTVLPLQLLAYHVAVLRGCDVDRPRNLAKSVTVE